MAVLGDVSRNAREKSPDPRLNSKTTEMANILTYDVSESEYASLQNETFTNNDDVNGDYSSIFQTPAVTPVLQASANNNNNNNNTVFIEENFNLSTLLGLDMNDSNSSVGNVTEVPPYNLPRLSVEIQIALYSIIFVLALVGNLLIIITLIQNKRMRTVTNVFLLNLAISDLLLALVCMPFTLVPVLLMDFVFGSFMCVFIRYLQAVSVGVSCFTLVAISLE
ncbi:cholecystokinin receptor type A, partial [Aplysia californica]|uniref:Cholecystokinin receptor type A n=1 Tax=Aplysia californica TaxID=6500 RepID=A0ABM1A6E8_APLCA